MSSTTGTVGPSGCYGLGVVILDKFGSVAPLAVTPSSVWPVFESRERLARTNVYFVYSTGNGGDFTKGGLTVPAGSFLNVRTCNIGTKTAFVTKRIFDSNHSSPVAYGGVASPVALAGATVSNVAAASTSGSNVTVGQPASTTLQMTYSVGTGHVDNAAGNAVPSGTGFIPPYDKYELTELRIIPPGQCFGQYVNGAASGLGSIQLGFRMYAYEE